MLWNYLKISFRKFTNQKSYSLLNILGLATGMATVMLIMLYVADELGYDRFHTQGKDLYRVVENQFYSGQPVFPVAVTPGPLAKAMKEEFPEVEMATRVHFGMNSFHQGESNFDGSGIYVDDDFLRMFDFPFLRGDAATALKEINSIVITEDLAGKLFGEEEALGKIIKVNRDRDVQVTGILKDIPRNSHLQFEFIMPMAQRLTEIPSFHDNWGSNALYTYVKLVSGASYQHFNGQIQKFLETKVEKSITEFYLQPIGDIHLGEVSFVADVPGKGNMQYVRIFTLVAVFILIIACINFMNLSTARATKRSREVGLRKSVGAFRYQLILQFLGESVLVALVAMCISLLLVELLLTPFNWLTQKTLSIEYSLLAGGGILPICLGAAIVTGLLAGSYPAVFLSAYQPAHVLKGTIPGKSGGGSFRKALVILQFSISIVMISGTIVIYSQMEYIRNKNLGWERENVVLIRNANNYTALKNSLLSHSQIKGVSSSDQKPTQVMNSTDGITWKLKNEDEGVLFHTQGVDYDYLETMKIEMLMGRTFSRSSPGDTLSAIINEAAMQVLGFENPVGEYLTDGEGVAHQIVGVTKDFHFKSVHDKIEPLLLYIDVDLPNMLVRIAGNAESAIKAIENEWAAVNPDQLLSYNFLDEDFDNLYQSESQAGVIFQYFSALAIIISSLGLFGLAAYTVEQKNKEYGIRKVFGASVIRLFYLASAEFLLLVVVAFFISVPVAWLWMRHWLNTFAYHVELSWVVFVASGATAVAIALITVSYQAAKVGIINPATTLRSE